MGFIVHDSVAMRIHLATKKVMDFDFEKLWKSLRKIFTICFTTANCDDIWDTKHSEIFEISDRFVCLWGRLCN